jgi:hypothetical protein
MRLLQVLLAEEPDAVAIRAIDAQRARKDKIFRGIRVLAGMATRAGVGPITAVGVICPKIMVTGT